ncbi:oxaloacetate decarboxylase [Roseibium sp. RKSG952]|uniref:isocitrate lyase/PEP mutase family protein n=1 Tax=Roseibium sp. RKSG952 TaxID=2529384 RepID=UPI0012BB4FD2|nr:oxaloacetate decarboxylase [Roseibium sp. RKSG952]MTH96015.1 oxaloacetate decarboxylase [Roseibium sp. RKSG952]
MKKTTLFKTMLKDPKILSIPVAHDALCARIIEMAGFSCVGCAGYANSATLLAAPDVELLTLDNMVDCAWRIADAVDLPVWVDGDTGHGNVTNTIRTVQQFEKAGAVSIMLEDQVSPKRCGHMSGKEIIPTHEYVAKIKAAVDTRLDDDFTILARTDAVAVNGLEDAVERANAAIEAGADWVFIEAPPTLEVLKSVPSLVSVPTLANMVPGGKTPLVSESELEAFGFGAVAYPTAFTYVFAKIARELAIDMRRTGSISGWEDKMIEFDEFNKLVDLNKIRDREKKYYSDMGK